MAFCAVADDEALELGGNEDDITDMLAGVENAVCDADVDRRASEADTDGETDTDDVDVSSAVCVEVVELVGRADPVTDDDDVDDADVVAGTEYVGDVDVVGFDDNDRVGDDDEEELVLTLALTEADAVPVFAPVAEAEALREVESDRVRVELSMDDTEVVGVDEIDLVSVAVRETVPVSVPVVE